MAIAITASDPTTALAAQMLELDNLNADIDTKNLESARQQQQVAIQQQVKKLHDAASAERTGAWVQGIMLVAGSAAEFGATATAPADPKLPTPVGSSYLKDMSQALTTSAGVVPMFSGARQGDDQADAKAAEARAADAQARAEEAEHHRDRMDQMSDRTLSSVNDIINSQDQGNIALIANI
jgi:hypothetical protein